MILVSSINLVMLKFYHYAVVLQGEILSKTAILKPGNRELGYFNYLPLKISNHKTCKSILREKGRTRVGSEQSHMDICYISILLTLPGKKKKQIYFRTREEEKRRKKKNHLY